MNKICNRVFCLNWSKNETEHDIFSQFRGVAKCVKNTKKPALKRIKAGFLECGPGGT